MSVPAPRLSNAVLTALLLLVTAVWGATFTVVKDATASYGVISFLAVRFVIGLACLFACRPRPIPKASLAVGGMIGLALAASYLFQTYGLCYTTATNSGLITGLFVVFAPLSSRVLFGVRTTPVLWAAIGLSLAGLYLLTGADLSAVSLGDLLTLGAAGGFGLQIALLGRFARDHDTVALAIVQVAVASLVFLAAWPLTEPFRWPAPEVWVALLVTGVLATAAGFAIQTLAQKHVPAARVAVIINMESVFALFFGYLLAGDRLSIGQAAGAALVIAAAALAEIGPAVVKRNGTPK